MTIDTSAAVVKRIAASLPSAVWPKDFGPQEVVLALLAERGAALARAEQAEADADSWKTRADLSQAATAAKNAQILDLIEALRGRNDGEICGCGVDNPTDVCLSHYDVIEAVVRNRIQAAIARAEQAETRVVELEAALVAAHEMRKAADRVSEWFCTEASHLEGPRIQALRACMLAYDRQMWLFPSTTLSQENGE